MVRVTDAREIYEKKCLQGLAWLCRQWNISTQNVLWYCYLVHQFVHSKIYIPLELETFITLDTFRHFYLTHYVSLVEIL